MAVSSATPKRPRVDSPDDGLQSAVKSQRRENHTFAVGDWVLAKPDTRRQVDKLKAATACLIVALDADSARVLYPNLLFFFMHQHDGASLVRFRTETYPTARLTKCGHDKIASLDRKMVMAICAALASPAASPPRESDPASSKAVSAPDDVPVERVSSSSCKATVLDKTRLQLFTASLSRVFQSESRSVLEKGKLEAVLLDTFSAGEIAAGFSQLDALNKIMLAEESVFLIE